MEPKDWFIKAASENPVLCLSVVGKGSDNRCVCQRKKIANQMLKHDKIVWLSFFVIPNLVRDLDFRFYSPAL